MGIKSPQTTLLFVSIGLICGSLPNPKNGRVTFESTRVGSVATYECNKGFVLVGKSSRVCLDTGKWSGDDPQCERKQKKRDLYFSIWLFSSYVAYMY